MRKVPHSIYIGGFLKSLAVLFSYIITIMIVFILTVIVQMLLQDA